MCGKLKFDGSKPSPLGKVARRSRDGRGQYGFAQTSAIGRDDTATSSVKNQRFLPAIALWYDCHRQSLKCQFPAGAPPKGEALGRSRASVTERYRAVPDSLSVTTALCTHCPRALPAKSLFFMFCPPVPGVRLSAVPSRRGPFWRIPEGPGILWRGCGACRRRC